jgi:hypothetical protein
VLTGSSKSLALVSLIGRVEWRGEMSLELKADDNGSQENPAWLDRLKRGQLS